METVIARNVADMPPDQRRSFEQAIGTALDPQQRVFFMTSTPGSVAELEARGQAHDRLMAVIEKVASYQKAVGITQEEADMAIDAAIENVRHRLRG